MHFKKSKTDFIIFAVEQCVCCVRHDTMQRRRRTANAMALRQLPSMHAQSRSRMLSYTPVNASMLAWHHRIVDNDTAM
jgi:hypothetical protein